MLHARSEGEEFSVSLGEFSSRNIPILYRPGVGTRQPLENNQAQKDFYYHNISELKSKIAWLVKSGVPKNDYNAYKDFGAKAVIERFKSVLLDSAFETRQQNGHARGPYECNRMTAGAVSGGGNNPTKQAKMPYDL
jgi:hypothetical protein